MCTDACMCTHTQHNQGNSTGLINYWIIGRFTAPTTNTTLTLSWQ